MSTVRERLLARTVTTANDCWLFQGSLWKGYGRIKIDGRNQLAHRAIWETEHGPIPEGMTIDHTCLMTACLNTKHMELVTRAENARRAAMRTGWGQHQRSKTACRNGHPYSVSNTHIVQRSNGKTERRCKTCAREAEARFKKEKSDGI